MEQNINIAEILKDKPNGTKLYADAFGELSIEDIYAGGKDELGITLSSKDGDELLFYNDGKYNIYGEPILVPSKEMRDWSKFSWKKGDVLVSRGGTLEVIFDGFDDDDYVTFKGKHALKTIEGESEYKGDSDDGYDFYTENYHLESEDAAQTYINTIEEKLGGKLNRETLEIEKTQPEFKDGDIVFMKEIKSELFANCIFILRSEYKDGDERAFYYAFYNADDKYTLAEYGNTKVHYSLRPATDSEKQQLFDALAKEGKAWDSEHKMIVDLKQKAGFKPFDKVLVRDDETSEWKANFYSQMGAFGGYECISGVWGDCIPYEGNEHLLGTTDNFE